MKLKILREKINKTQKEVADELNIQRTKYARYENEESDPSVDMLLKLANYYKVTIDELVGHEVPYLIDKSLLSEKQINVINLIQKLNDYQCDRVESFIMGLSMAELERQQTIDKFNNRGA